MRLKKYLEIGLFLGLFLATGSLRPYLENKKSTADKSWDPRDFQLLEEVEKLRESESFRARIASGQDYKMAWPGLQNAYVSWIWLEMLQGMHHESSYDRDYSWLFSKLHTIISNSNKKELRYISTLAPFYFVIGKDFVGASVISQELISRAPNYYNSWFWSGYHAIENLKDRQQAGDYYLKAAQFSEAPAYISSLALRLKKGNAFFDNLTKGKLLKAGLPDELVEKLKKSHPHYFNDK